VWAQAAQQAREARTQAPAAQSFSVPADSAR